MKKLGFCILVLLMAGSYLSCSPVKFKTQTSENPPPKDDGTGQWWAVYGPCSQACNGTEVATSFVCKSANLAVLPDSYCKEAKPTTKTRECNKDAPACVDNGQPYWDPSGFGTCSPACGDGMQYQTVVCRDRQTTSVLADSNCTGDKPATEQRCSTTCSCTPVNKTKSGTVPAGNNKVDILLVIDDSKSMVQDNAKLGERLTGFVTDLQNNNLDWQMCITTTDVNYFKGRPSQWTGTNSIVINKNTPSLVTVIPQTIYDVGTKCGDVGCSNDEQGIHSSIKSLEVNSQYPCYRSGAAYVSIIISDEDERSVGGNCSLSSQQCKPLDFYYNEPATLTNILRGQNKRMAVNSIVVKDQVCRTAQNAQGTPSYIGTKYYELASLTSGSSGNICDSNYSTNLQYFKDAVLEQVSSVTLDCTPSSAPTVTLPAGYNWSLNGNAVTITPALSPGMSYNISYQCCP